MQAWLVRYARLSLSKLKVKLEIKVSLMPIKNLKKHGDNHQHHTDFFKDGNQRSATCKNDLKQAIAFAQQLRLVDL
ncbi:MAG: hypothetical protein KME27_17435 [Lyngbya sp. HA4199-MV5]|jgi:hypothetical protein|nr:hypothetical protein [Lyngbya sp. HA4199-MV5]